MNFLEEARVILQHQAPDEVECFLSACDGNIPVSAGDAFEYRRAADPVIKQIRKDIRALERLKRENPNAMPKPFVDGRINELELYLEINDSLNTGGKPTALTVVDLTNLYLLQAFYRRCFPRLSDRFKEGNLLSELGEALIGRSLPDSVERLLARQKEVEMAMSQYWAKNGELTLEVTPRKSPESG